MRTALPIILLLLVALSCSSKKKAPPTPAQGVNLEQIRTQARQFRPEIGKRGGELVGVVWGEPGTWNLAVANGTSSTSILSFLFEGLVSMNAATGEVRPWLAESWSHSDNGLVWTVHLRPKVLWSDGVPLTAEDVLFTLNDVIYNDSIVTGMREILTIARQKIKARKIDDLTVEFTLPAPFAVFDRAMGFSILPKHRLEKFVKNNSFNSAWGIGSAPSEIVGTGPFVLRQYEPGQRVILARNDHYWKKDSAGHSLPYLDRVVILLVKDKNATILKFKNREADIVELISGDDFPVLKPFEKEQNFTLHRLGSRMGDEHLMLNQNAGINPKTKQPYVDPVKLQWFSNKRFRQALAYAINRESMVRIVLNGLGSLQDGPMNPSAGYFCKSSLRHYEFNPDRARQILKDEGFTDKNGDGFLEDAGGHTVEFVILTNYGNTRREQFAKMIRKDLENIGIKAHYNLVEFNSLVDKEVSSYDWDAIVLGLTGGDDPYEGGNIWHSYSPHHSWHPNQPRPATAWEKRVDEIYDLAIKEMDRTKRKALYDEWQDSVAENLPLIFLPQPEKIYAVRNRFGNVNPSPLSQAYNSDILGFFHNIEEVFVR